MGESVQNDWGECVVSYVRHPRLSKGPPTSTVEFHLTDRELEFAKLRFGKSLCYKEIAVQMNIVESTVKSYAKIIYLKLGVCDLGRPGGGAAAIKATNILLAKHIIELEEPQ
jgi:DNA-binding NarL/FixJ family response regulator